MEDLIKMFPVLTDKIGNNEELAAPLVFAAWKRAVGQDVENHTSPSYFSRGKLSVFVENKAWLVNLTDLSPTLIYNVNKMLGKKLVTFIDLKVNAEIFVKNLADKRTEKPASYDKTLMKAAKNISDDGLREKFLSAATACLTHRKI